MAATVDQANIGTKAATGVLSTTFDTTATVAVGGMLVVLNGRFNAGTPTATMAVSGGGLTWVNTLLGTSGNMKLYISTALAPAGLASGTTLTVTQSSGTGDITLVASSYLGLASATPTAQNSTATATTAWASGTVGAANGDLLVGGAWGDGSLVTSTATGPGVERVDFNSATTNESVTLIDKLTVTGSDSLAGTWSATIDAIGAAASFTASPDAGIDAFRVQLEFGRRQMVPAMRGPGIDRLGDFR